MTIISDGTGKGYNSKVDSQARLFVYAITEEERVWESIKGNAYNLNTGDITLTTDSKSAVMYLKNTGTSNYIIPNIFYNLEASTGGSGSSKITILRNPTTGTIVSDATAVSMNINRNFASNNTLTADVYKGGEGKTFTNGTDAIESLIVGANRVAIAVGGIVLSPGNSIGVNVTPPTGNTSMKMNVAIELYKED